MTTPLQPDFPVSLIALDLDGTLLNSRRQISELNLFTIRRTSQKGKIIALVSGRPQCALLGFFRQIGLDIPLISSGGAYIAFPVSGKVLSKIALTNAEIHRVVRLARHAEACIIIENENIILCENPGKHLERNDPEIFSPITVVEDVLQALPTHPTKIAIVGDPHILAEFLKRSAPLSQRLNIVTSSSWSVDVTHYHANKGNALRLLARELDIPLHQTLAIGDSFNDLSMFAVAGFSVAMGNAVPEVKNYATYLAPGNDKDGVAWALETFSLNNDRKPLKP